MNKIFVALALAGAVAAAPAHAGVLFDQISTDYSNANSYVWDSQQFDAPNSAFDVNLLDDFTLGASYDLSSVDAAISGYNGFSSMSGITGYRVEIYSSIAAAANSLVGDVASVTVASGDITSTSPFSMTWGPSGLVHIPVDISLAAGTYYLGVMTINSFSNGQSGILIDPTKTGDAVQVNPNGGFGYTGGIFPTNPPSQASYRISGDLTTASPAPEPATWGMMLLGFGAVGAVARRRKLIPARA
jgi:hypothetical protein